MAYTLRCNQEQEEDIQKVVELTYSKTVSNAIHKVVMRYPSLVKQNETLMRELSDLQKEYDELLRTVKTKIENDAMLTKLAESDFKIKRPEWY